MHELVAGYHLDSNVFIPWEFGQPVGSRINGSPVCVDSCLEWIPAQPGSSIYSRPTTLPQRCFPGLPVQVRSLCCIPSQLSAGSFRAPIRVDIYSIHSTWELQRDYSVQHTLFSIHGEQRLTHKGGIKDLLVPSVHQFFSLFLYIHPPIQPLSHPPSIHPSIHLPTQPILSKHRLYGTSPSAAPGAGHLAENKTTSALLKLIVQ